MFTNFRLFFPVLAQQCNTAFFIDFQRGRLRGAKSVFLGSGGVDAKYN